MKSRCVLCTAKRGSVQETIHASCKQHRGDIFDQNDFYILSEDFYALCRIVLTASGDAEAATGPKEYLEGFADFSDCAASDDSLSYRQT
jgi:hypothetical protein